MTAPVVARPGSPRAWLLAVRPQTLPASAAPVILGWAVAARTGPAPAHLGAACLAVAMSLQIAANLANDLFDSRSGVDRGDRLGPVRVTQTGLLRPRQVMTGLAIALTIGAAAGVYAAWHAGWWLLGLGAVCMAGAVAYTAGPFPLARRGLGEVAALVFFGPVACTGTAVVLGGAATPTAWLAGLVPGLHAAALMAVNNLRDRRQDARAGKRTLAVVIGERGARLVPALCLAAGNLVAAPLALVSARPAVSAALLLLPVSWPLIRRILDDPISPELNGVLARVGRWEFATCAVLAILMSI